MATLKQCDRCKTISNESLLELDLNANSRISYYGKSYDEARFELCTWCQNDFTSFITNKISNPGEKK